MSHPPADGPQPPVTGPGAPDAGAADIPPTLRSLLDRACVRAELRGHRADVVLDDARFAMRELTLGLVPDLGGTLPLVAAVGYPRALEKTLKHELGGKS